MAVNQPRTDDYRSTYQGSETMESALYKSLFSMYKAASGILQRKGYAKPFLLTSPRVTKKSHQLRGYSCSFCWEQANTD